MPCAPKFYRQHTITIARDEWKQIDNTDMRAASFILARIRQVSLAPDSRKEAACDVYDVNLDIYLYVYGTFCMYYTIVPGQGTLLEDVVVLLCGNVLQTHLDMEVRQRRHLV